MGEQTLGSSAPGERRYIASLTGVASISYYLVERPFYRLKSFRQIKDGGTTLARRQ
jgi:hypothetical protein